MPIETLRDALFAGWRVRARCSLGKRDGMKSIRECAYQAEVSLETLVWTRGPNFPVSSLGARMMCPRCGSRRVTVMFMPPEDRRSATGG